MIKVPGSTGNLVRVSLLLLVLSNLNVAQLVLGRPPIFETNAFSQSGSGIKYAVEGETVRLNCDEATLAESYEWRIGDANGPLVSSSRIAEVTATRDNNSKSEKLRCVAKNSVATVLSMPHQVRAKYLDDFDASDDTVQYTVTTGIGRYFVLRRPRLVASSELEVTYSWFKDDSHQVTSNGTHFVTSEGDLVVTEVKAADFGRYKLVASSEDLSEIVSNVYTVENNGISPSVQNALSIVYWSQEKLIVESLMPKDEVFECVTSFNRDVRIRWFLDGQLLSGSEVGVSITSNNRRLVVSNPSGFTKGEHKVECKADAAMGRTFDQKEVVFNFVAHPQLRDLPEELHRPAGSTLTMRCAVKKNKQMNVDVQWYRNGVSIKTHRGRLIIDSISSEDYGLYQCEASNEAGSDVKTMWLKEGDDTDAVIAFSEDGHRSSEDASNAQKDEESTHGIRQHQPSHQMTESKNDGADVFGPPMRKHARPPMVARDEQVGANLDLIDPPSLVKTPKDVTIASGTAKLVLECVAKGTPQPRIMWFFNGHEIHSEATKYDVTSEGLTVHDVRKSDEGEYTCEIAGGGNETRAVAMVHVNGDTLIEYGPTDQKSLIGTNVEFSCEVAKEYARRATVDWYLNDMQLATNGNSGLRISRNRKGSLIIRQVGPDNTGEYKCVVRVDGREESATAMLQIIEKPAMPERVRAELHNETMPAKVRVLWNEGFDGNEPIIKHAIEMRTLGPTGLWSDWSSVIDNIPKEESKPCCWADIEDLRPSSTAEFRVVASNKHGPGKASLPSGNVTMPQQPPSAAPRNVAASARSSHSIIVQWQQPKEESASGDVLGYVVRYRLAGYSSLLSWNEKNLTTKDARNAVIDELITWREYEVQVAAYNKRGLGVFSGSIEVMTAEGVPTQAPKNVRMKVLNSTAVEVDFTMPDQQKIPGVNLGYKVQFWKGEPQKGQLYKQILLDPDRKHWNTVVDGLEKYGHYNLSVLCFTSPGDGPRSNSIEVRTEEDVPEGVDGLSIAEVMYNGAVLTWNTPLHENGVITKYTIRHWSSTSPDVKTKHEVDGSTTNITIEGLQPSTRYGVDVMASTKKGDGPLEETKFESGVPPELPGRPSSVSIGEIAATTTQLIFTPGFDGHTAIRQWVVEAKIADSSVFTHIFNVSSPKARSITVSGLRPYTQYQLRLIAENVKGRGAPSEPSRVFETLQTNPESPSARLLAEPVSSTSIGVSWTPLLATQWNGQPKGYLIVYRETDDSEWKEVRTPALRASEYTLSDLKPFTAYEVNVFSENAFGRSVATDAVKAKTYESVPSGSPRNIRATSDGSKAVIVKWEPVAEMSTNGEVIGYKIRVIPEREPLMSEESREVDVPGQATLISKVTNLRPYTTYQVYVSAYTIVGHGPENSTPILFETAEDVPTSPESFQCSFVNENEVRLKWLPPNPPNGKITSYIISYWKSHEPRTMAIDAPLLGNLLMFSATSLSPNTQYMFVIKALNSKGESEETVAEVMTTSARVPLRNAPVPTRDEQAHYSATEIAIRWDDGDVGGMVAEDVESPIRLVQVSYQKTNDDEWTALDRKFDYSKKRGVVRRLTPNSSYRFRVRYIGDFLESSWSAESEWMRTLPSAPLAQPISVQATPYETTSLHLEWIVPHKSTWNSDVIGYRIHWREYPSNDTWHVEEIAPNGEHQDKEEKIIGKLASFRHYIVRMRMFNSEGEGPFSTPVFVYVGYAIPKRNVTNLMTEPLSSSSMRVKWDAWPAEQEREQENGQNTDIVTSFKVRYVPVASVLSPVSTEEEVMIVDTNSCVLNDLRKFTEYQISVSGYNRAGEGKSSVVRAKTLEDVPGPVGQLVFTDVLMDSVRITWDEPKQPNGVVTGYVVNYKGYRMQEEFKNEDQKRTSKNSFSAIGLAEGVTYYFVVWAETAAGKGEQRSANVTIGPNKNGPAAPTRPVVVPGQSSVTLQWRDMPNGETLIGHLIQAKRVSAAEETEHGYVSQRPRREQKRAVAEPLTASASSQRPTHAIGEWVTLRATEGTSEKEHVSYRDLQPSSFYVFRVFARNQRGVGVASAESEQLFVPEAIPDEPFYTTWWFMALVGMAAFVLIVIIVAILCITGSTAKYRREKRARSVDSLQLADGNFASFQLKGTGGQGQITRSRELPTRPGTTQSWLSDREPPAYGSVLGDHPHGHHPASVASGNVVNMYGLATDVIPPLPNAEAMQRLSALVGRDVRSGGSAYVSSRGSEAGGPKGDYASRSEYGNRSDYGRVEYGSHMTSSGSGSTPYQMPTSALQHQNMQHQPLQQSHAYDSFDEEEDVESVDMTTIRGDVRRRGSKEEGGSDQPDGADDIARHYGSTDHYRDTWRRVRDTDAVRGAILPSHPSSAAGRTSSSTTESASESAWPHHNAPNLATGFSSFV